MAKTLSLLAAASLLALGSSHVLAQPSAEARIEKLEETVRTLERRVEVLEEQLRQRQRPSSSTADKSNWRQLRRGMSDSEVEKLLGSPTRVDAYGSFTVWYYGSGPGGRVQFESRSGTVESWSEPR